MSDFGWGMQAAGYRVSISTGNIKPGPGILRAVWCTTGGSFAFNDGAVPVAQMTLAANTLRALPGRGVYFENNISVSASAGVGTMIFV